MPERRTATGLERILDRTVERLIRGCEFSAVVLGIWLTAALIASVFFRYVLNSSLTWVDESSSLLLVWLMLVVAPIGFHQNLHISVSVLIERAPRASRVMLGIFINACVILLFGIAGYYGIFNTLIETGSELTSIAISRAWFTWVLPAGSLIVVLVSINNVAKILRRGDLLPDGESLE